ncbi:MAG: hypothetical protein PUB48_06170, partial [Solobacterium sp.]|nr:hypothetical protein [Solobacterium sp.]
YFGNKVSHKHLSDINTITLCNSTLILNRENETVKLKLLTIKDNENPFYIPEDTRSAKTIENIIKQINEYEVYITENKVLRTRYASHKIPKHQRNIQSCRLCPGINPSGGTGRFL